MINRLKIYFVILNILLFSGVIIAFDLPFYFLILLEIIVVLSVVFAWRWLNRIKNYEKLIQSSIENFRDEEYTLFYKKTGVENFDKLVNLYNTMVSNLRKERVNTNEVNYLLAKIINFSPSGIILFNGNNEIRTINDAARSILGWEGEFGDMTKEKTLNIVNQLEKEIWVTSSLPSGKRVRFYKGAFVNSAYENQFIILEDYTGLYHKMEKDLSHKIVRIMSHQINNTLGSVNSVLDSYISSRKDEFSKTFRVVRDRNDNLSIFMKRLSEIISIPEADRQEREIAGVLKSVFRSIQTTGGYSDIKLILNDEILPLLLFFDPILMEQAIINIFTNAIDEMPDKKGTIWVNYKKGENAIHIINSGNPISKENAENAFSTFYTSKRKGMGIGLTLVRDILNAHNFSYSLFLNKDGKTTFKIGLGD